MKHADVLVLNNIGGGFDIPVKRLPNPHETIMMKQMRLTEDLAKGGNVAVALARLGVPCAIIGKIGNDEAGRRDLGWMRDAGVDTDELIVSPDVATGQGIGIIADNGDNILITGESSSEKLTWEEVQAAMLRRKDARYFITGLEVRMPLVLRAAQLAKQLGMRVMFNPSPVPEGGLPDALDYVDDFFVNEVEAQLLLGLPAAEVDDNFNARGVCEALRARYRPARVFLTLGAKGSFCLDGQDFFFTPPVPVTSVDSCGAGDGYLAAVAANLVWGAPLQQACRWAAGYSAYAVTRHECLPGYADKATVEAFLAAHN